jgi:hypothetical protein
MEGLDVKPFHPPLSSRSNKQSDSSSADRMGDVRVDRAAPAPSIKPCVMVLKGTLKLMCSSAPQAWLKAWSKAAGLC